MIEGLPRRLHEERKKHGYLQRTLSKELNLSASVISSYETGERTPSIQVLMELADLYGCSVDYLLGRVTNDLPILDVEGLTDEQISIVRGVIAAIR